jgi:methylenetetrahydrofolate dehydrogenase (NADP+)/methenyltetrahydrofolate cyclohydrolase
MTAKIIDGTAIARLVRTEIRSRAQALVATHGIRPGLAVVMIGENPASAVYVRNKVRACADVGISSQVFEFPASVSEAETLDCIRRLNEDDGVHGILVQLPLPQTISVQRVLETISIDKDVDGFHLYNVGGLVAAMRSFRPARLMAFRNCSNTKASSSRAATSPSSAPAILSASRWR